MKILCTAEFDDAYIKELKKIAEVKQAGFSIHRDFREMLTPEQLVNELEGVDIFIVGYDKVTSDILQKASDLKLILSVRDGPEENIDVETCKKFGIPVLFSASRCQRVVPEHTMMMILASARPMIWANQQMYNGHWTKETERKNPDYYYDFYKTIDSSHEIFGKTLGLVGAGRNGIGLAERAQAFGMNVIAYDPYANKTKMDSLNIELKSLEEVMSQSDYVCMMARVTPETKNMIGEKELSLMKDGACFINTGRAALVDTDALLKILKTGRIKAAIDVYDKEPISKDNPFLKLDPMKVLLLPHFAGVSVERITFQSKAATDNIMDFLKGKKTTHVYDSSVFDNPEFNKRGGIIWNSTK